MDFSLYHPAEQIVMLMQRIYGYGMTTTSGGNLSIKDDNGDVWITPAGTDKGALRREDIVRIAKDGTVYGPHKPSSEYPFHLAVYRKRPDLKAVLHAHPPRACSVQHYKDRSGRPYNPFRLPRMRRCGACRVCYSGERGARREDCFGTVPAARISWCLKTTAF